MFRFLFSFFFAPDRGGESAIPKINQPAPAPAVVGTPDEQAAGHRRRRDTIHAQQLAVLNRDRAANGLPALEEVPGYFSNEGPNQEPPSTAPLPTGFAAQGDRRPVGTGGELGTSNERASVGKVPVGSSDVAVAQVERSVAQDQPLEGGVGSVPSGEQQASQPIKDEQASNPLTDQKPQPPAEPERAQPPTDAAGEPPKAPLAEPVNTRRQPADEAANLEAPQEPESNTIGNSGKTEQQLDAEAEALKDGHNREQLVDLAAADGVEVSSDDVKLTIARKIVAKRNGLAG